MKNKIVFILLVSFIFSQTAFAMPRPVQKLARGVEGLVTAPVEHWNEYQDAHHDNGILVGLTNAITTGTVLTVKRLINGVYDILTFPLPYPKPYRLLLKDEHETALQELWGNEGPEAGPIV